MRNESAGGRKPSLTFLVAPALEVRHQLKNSENNQTKPEIHECTQINLEPLMAGGRREVGIKRKIEAITEEDNHQPTDPSRGVCGHLFLRRRLAEQARRYNIGQIHFAEPRFHQGHEVII